MSATRNVRVGAAFLAAIVAAIAHPRRVRVAGRLGAGVLPDDMTIDRRGILYVAGFGDGRSIASTRARTPRARSRPA
jgi:hypothetical protein